jgi:Ras-related protein Rab-11A
VKDMADKEYVFKIAILGAAGAGKTSLIDQFVQRKFQQDYKPTLGASIIAKDMEIDKNTVRLVMWDIAGQEKYESVRSMYLSGAIGAILVYDLTRKPTFDEVRNKWIKDFRQYAMPEARYILIGNKADLEDKRNVSTADGQALAKELNTGIFLETSARNGQNVEAAFHSLVRDILKNIPDD